MSKPLELLIHPKPQHRNHVTGGWLWDCEACNTVITGPSKRLTNAELAAEYWRAQDDVSCADDPSGSKPGTWPNGYDRENGQFLDDARLETLERFATLPHYDEVPE